MKPRLRILHTEASCGWGGQEIRILEESRGMMSLGHQVTVACPPHAPIAKEALRYSIRVAPIPIEFKTISGFHALRQHLLCNAYDVVNTHSSADSWLTALACATILARPAIVRTRHISAPVSGNILNRWLYRQARYVITTGEKLRTDLLQALALAPEAVISIPTGIDTSRFLPGDKSAVRAELGLSPDLRYIGIVATLRSWKGHLVLLDAMSRLRDKRVHLVIVGDGPMREQIEQRIEDLGLSAQVILAGQQTKPERWMQAMDAFCLPSYANEGVPQALMQAMMTGLPVISTPIGAIPEIVQDGDTGILVTPRDPEALAAAIERIVGDHLLAARLGRAARASAVARFGFEQMIGRMDEIFTLAHVSAHPL
jgi:glycosyltransferase involved in cell wall biosynthesis